MQEMRGRGKFARFQTPSRMIAPFPTLTNVAMTELLREIGATESAGYEETYFDAGANRTRGTILDRFNNKSFIRGSFREFFDYHPSAFKSGLGYLAPPASTYLEAISDLVRLRQKFKASRAPIFFAYMGATDSLAHLGGKRLVRAFLNRLDATLKGLSDDYGGELEVTIFSDHGNHFTRYRRSDVNRAISAGGFKLENKVRDRRSVVLPQFGLIGCALLFTHEANERGLARAAANARGVDFAIYEQNKIVYIVTANGRATIERRDDKFRYQAQQGDPLDLLPTIARLSKNRPDGFINDDDWFTATHTHARPDAVNRIYRGATEYVKNRANVIVSFEDGYYSGSRLLDVFAFLQATHGNIRQEQSSGFVINTTRPLPETLRAEDVWTALGNPAISKMKSLSNTNSNR